MYMFLLLCIPNSYSRFIIIIIIRVKNDSHYRVNEVVEGGDDVR